LFIVRLSVILPIKKVNMRFLLIILILGPRFEIKDFLVKLGSVTIGGTVKGILVEVDYLPGIIPGTCWGLLAEFMQVNLCRNFKNKSKY